MYMNSVLASQTYRQGRYFWVAANDFSPLVNKKEVITVLFYQFPKYQPES